MLDNTFAGPLHCRPTDFDVDIVIESVSKALAGHNDVVLGGIVGSTELLAPIRRLITKTASLPAPFAAWLGTRGIASYALRQQRAADNASTLADWLESRAEVSNVYYPGLPSQPDHDTARAILSNGFGAILSVELEGTREHLDTFLASLTNVRLLMTLGGPATTIAHPASMTHRMLDESARAALGIGPNLLRVAVGIESIEDIIADFRRGFSALANAYPSKPAA